jgi:hypothetical protein
MGARRTQGYDGAFAHGWIDDVDGLFDERLCLVAGQGNPPKVTAAYTHIIKMTRGRRPFTTREYLAYRRRNTAGNGDTAELMYLVQEGVVRFVNEAHLCVRRGQAVCRRSSTLSH